jgi:hypothetical protein
MIYSSGYHPRNQGSEQGRGGINIWPHETIHVGAAFRMDVRRREILNKTAPGRGGDESRWGCKVMGNSLGRLTNGSVDRVWKPGSGVDVILSRR